MGDHACKLLERTPAQGVILASRACHGLPAEAMAPLRIDTAAFSIAHEPQLSASNPNHNGGVSTCFAQR